ncbi:MAG: hypothetical protein R6U70_09035 [Bacillota bacterium]
MVVRIINLAVINLAGVPSVVYGLFGLSLFVLFLGLGSSLGAASLTLGLMTLPRQVVLTHVLPYARSGIVAGALLGVSRAMGETAPILVTGVAVVLPRLPGSFSSRFMALPYQLYVSATQVPGMPRERIWASALTLVVLVLLVNAAAGLMRNR